MPRRAPYGTRRVDVRILTIPKNTDNPYAYDHAHRRRRPWEVRTKLPSCDATVTCVLSVLCLFLRFLAPVRVPHGFRKMPLRMQCGPQALEQPTANLADQYGAKTGPVKPTSMDAVWTTHDHGPKIVGSPSLKALHAHLTAMGYTTP